MPVISLDKVHDNELNPRTRYVMLEELADSIKRYGLFEAVKLQQCTCGKMAGEHYRVIDGHRRVRAVRMLRSYLQESECQTFDLDREKEIAMMVEMNLKRDNYTPVERYRALKLETPARSSERGGDADRVFLQGNKGFPIGDGQAGPRGQRTGYAGEEKIPRKSLTRLTIPTETVVTPSLGPRPSSLRRWTTRPRGRSRIW